MAPGDPYRLYLTSSAAPISPTANSGWEATAGVTRGLLSPTKAGANAALAVAETTAAANHDVLLGQWVSAPFTHGGSVEFGVSDVVVARQESDAAANFETRIAFRVLSGDGSVIRDELAAVSTTEWTTTLTAFRAQVDITPFTVTCQAGDRLVIEYGYKAQNTVTTSFTGTIRHGGTAGDLVNGDTASVTTNSPYVDFYGDVAALFSWGADAWEGTIDGSLAVEAAFAADLTDDTEWVWQDITSDVRYESGIELVHGRGDEAATSQPASCSLTLDNRSGDYSTGPESDLYPFVRRGVPIRVRADIGDGWVTLFQGAADTWNPSWAGGPSGDATVALGASGALRRLEQGAAPVQSVMTRTIAAATATVAHWPCEDDANSDTAASALPDHPPIQYTGDIPSFGTAPGELVCTASLVTLNNARLVAEVPTYTTATEQCIRWLASFSTSELADATVIMRAYCPGGSAPLWEVMGGTAAGALKGTLRVVAYDTSGTIVEDTGEIGFGTAGRALMMSLEMTQDGADIDYLLVTRQVGMPGVLSTSGTVAGETFGNVSFIEFGPNGDVDSLAIGQVHVQDTIVGLEIGSTVNMNAFRFEQADTRIQRLCDENSVTVAIAGDTAVRMGPQHVDTLLALLRECEATDQGILYDGIGPGLAYICKSNRVSQDPDLTLDAAAGEVDQPQPVDDDQRTRNLVEASRPSGGSAVAVDTDGPMGTEVIGIYDEAVSVSPEGDTLLADYAAWFVHVGTIRGYRYPDISFQLHRDPTLASAWLDTFLGARVDITNIEDVRSQHPAGTISLMLEGYRQRLDQFTWFVELVCSPYEPWIVGTIAAETGDTDEHSWRLASDGSTLAAAASAGATSLSVATPSGPLWTTTADDCPLIIEVEGTPITVTAIAGGSSPQTFTVTGSTVVRALSSGAEVTLRRHPVLGLPF